MEQTTYQDFIEKIKSHKLKVEDYCTVKLYGQDVRIVCIGRKHDNLVGGGKAEYTFGTYETVSDSEMDFHSARSYKDTYLRGKLNNEVFEQLPKELCELIVPVCKLTQGEESEEKIFLFSESEVFGDAARFDSRGGKQYEFFKEWRNRFKHASDNDRYSDWWWLRSPYYSGSAYFVCVRSGGNASGSYASSGYGVSFGFCTK